MNLVIVASEILSNSSHFWIPVSIGELRDQLLGHLPRTKGRPGMSGFPDSHDFRCFNANPRPLSP